MHKWNRMHVSVCAYDVQSVHKVLVKQIYVSLDLN